MSEDVSDEVRAVVRDVLDKGPEDLRACWTACAEAGLLDGRGGPGHRVLTAEVGHVDHVQLEPGVGAEPVERRLDRRLVGGAQHARLVRDVVRADGDGTGGGGRQGA